MMAFSRIIVVYFGSWYDTAYANRIDAADRVLEHAGESADSLTMEIPGGTIQGIFGTAWNGKRYRRWTNIPYGESTAGANRFRPPKPWKGKWDGVRKATEFGSKCPQVATPGIPDTRASNISEDCLNLNIWAPEIPSVDLLPVYVEIYGGGYKYGSSNVGQFDGGELSTSGNVIQVGPNFRTGIFGFLALEELMAEQRTTGNQGMQDARLALEWIHANIRFFGGDPNRITIGGVSSGGGTVVALSTSLQLQRGLIYAVSSESPMPTFYELKDALAKGDTHASALSCTKNRVACLQGLSWDQVQNYFDASGSFIFPVIDGHEWTKQPADSEARYDGPLYIGSTTMEGTIFTGAFKSLLVSQARVYAAWAAIFGVRSPKVMWEYSINRYASHGDNAAWYAFSDTVGDILFTCPARKHARKMAKTKSVYYWLFGKIPDCDGFYQMQADYPDFWKDEGPYHGITVPYFNGNSADAGEPVCYKNTTEKLNLFNTVHTNFINFIRSGSPNSANLNDFSKYIPGEWKRTFFDTPVHFESSFKDSKCDMWESFGLERAFSDLMWTMDLITSLTQSKSLAQTGRTQAVVDDATFFGVLHQIDLERAKRDERRL